MHKLVSPLVLALSLLGLAGCDSSSNKNSGSASSSSNSSSSSSSSSSSGGVELGNVQMHFPPATASTDKANIRVRGRVVDSAGVARVTINGTEVTSTDNLATWSLDVPLDAGINELLVAQEDSAGVVSTVETLRIERNTQFVSPRFVIQDAANNRLLVLDVSQDSVIAVDAQTGARSQLSPPAGETENKISNATGLMLDPVRNRVLVFQKPVMTVGDNAEFLAVDLSTGAQTEFTAIDFSDRYLNHTPTAMLLTSDTAFVADTELLYLDTALNRLPKGDAKVALTIQSTIIYSLDLATGTRTLVSAYQHPDLSNLLVQVHSLTHDPAQSTLYALNRRENGASIVKVNTITGARTELTIKNTTANPFVFNNPKSMALDLDSKRLLLLNGTLLNAIDIASGTVTVVSSNTIPTGEEYRFGSADNMAYDPAADTVYLIDDALDILLRIHGTDGSRSRVSSNGPADPSAGLTNRGITSLALGSNPYQTYLADRPLNTLFAYQLQTGVKTILSNPILDEADDKKLFVVIPQNVTWDTDANRLLLVNGLNELITVDPQTGKAGTLLRFSSNLEVTDTIYIPGSQSMYISSRLAIFKTVLGETNASSVVSANGVPSAQNNFNDLRAIALDTERNRLLGVDAALNTLMAVDIATGARTPISSQTIPATDGGPVLQIPRALVVDGDRALVLDTGRKAIIAIDLVSGVRSVFYDYQNAVGTRLYNPTAMELHPQFGYLLLADDVTDALMALDLQTLQLLTLTR